MELRDGEEAFEVGRKKVGEYRIRLLRNRSFPLQGLDRKERDLRRVEVQWRGMVRWVRVRWVKVLMVYLHASWRLICLILATASVDRVSVDTLGEFDNFHSFVVFLIS